MNYPANSNPPARIFNATEGKALDVISDFLPELQSRLCLVSLCQELLDSLISDSRNRKTIERVKLILSLYHDDVEAYLGGMERNWEDIRDEYNSNVLQGDGIIALPGSAGEQPAAVG